MGVEKSFILKTISVARALLTGRCVNETRMRERVEICSKCPLVVTKGKFLRCGVCGCPAKESGLINLARYEETAAYGCEHPEGSRWKEAGV
jgi:hypothetical protein